MEIINKAFLSEMCHLCDWDLPNRDLSLSFKQQGKIISVVLDQLNLETYCCGRRKIVWVFFLSKWNAIFTNNMYDTKTIK